jgi:hypothetical protein
MKYITLMYFLFMFSLRLLSASISQVLKCAGVLHLYEENHCYKIEVFFTNMFITCQIFKFRNRTNNVVDLPGIGTTIFFCKILQSYDCNYENCHLSEIFCGSTLLLSYRKHPKHAVVRPRDRNEQQQ